MRTDITKETLQAAIDELGERDKIAERLGINPHGLYYWLRKFGLELPVQPMKGRNGEAAVYFWLQAKGIRAKLAAYNSPFDLTVNDKRVEVKTAPFEAENGGWHFNIHRHNKLDESQVDLYILRLEQVPFSKAAIHLVMTAPLNTKSVKISLRSLLTRYAQHYNRLDLLSS